MVALLFVNVVINYVDRSNLSVAASMLSSDLELSTIEMGYIFSAFGWAYAGLQIPGGILADRFLPRNLYTVCLAMWSFATACLSWAGGYLYLFMCRLGTGAFEAPAFPINNRVVTTWVPGHERASAIALYTSGQFLGLAFLTPLLFVLRGYVGWRGLFLITGVAGIIWAAVWYFLYRDPSSHSGLSDAERNYIKEGGALSETATSTRSPWRIADLWSVLRHRTLWGVYLTQFTITGILWFFLTWFPTYLEKYRGIDLKSEGYLASIPFLAACLGLLLSGFVSDSLIRRGWSVERARKTPVIIGLLLAGSICGANFTDNLGWIIFFMSVAFYGSGTATISWIFVSLLAPRNLIGLTGGVFNFIGNLASIVVPIVIGYLIKDNDFAPAMFFVGGLGLAGALLTLFMIGSLKRVEQEIE